MNVNARPRLSANGRTVYTLRFVNEAFRSIGMPLGRMNALSASGGTVLFLMPMLAHRILIGGFCSELLKQPPHEFLSEDGVRPLDSLSLL